MREKEGAPEVTCSVPTPSWLSEEPRETLRKSATANQPHQNGPQGWTHCPLRIPGKRVRVGKMRLLEDPSALGTIPSGDARGARSCYRPPPHQKQQVQWVPKGTFVQETTETPVEHPLQVPRGHCPVKIWGSFAFAVHEGWNPKSTRDLCPKGRWGTPGLPHLTGVGCPVPC
jgi:hypothetical protein